ncbi:class II aldolase/adducin family protein [Nocardia africana]|uniref:Class II aldolase/adducin family protein n=1 Tax=Nocardia africana TaxID=134964 RepID=A0ABW6NJE4_9NOCA
MKASGWDLYEITSARVHLVDRGGKIVDGEGAGQFEFRIHTAIMAARRDVGGGYPRTARDRAGGRRERSCCRSATRPTTWCRRRCRGSPRPRT